MKVNSNKRMRWFIPFFIFTIISFSEGFSQNQLSKKQRKQQEKETLASRLFVEGQKFLMLEEYEKAYFYFEKALQHNPQAAAINFKLAEILAQANKNEKALEYGMRAADADPDNKYYQLLIAEIYNKQNKTKEAAEVLQSLVENASDSQPYILDLASLYLASQEFDKALEALDQAEEFYGVVEQLTAQKQRIYLRKNDLESAIEEGEKLINGHPGNSQYVLALVEILFNNNRADQALEVVLEALETYTNQPELQMAAHTLYKEKYQLDLAREYILKAYANPDLDGQIKAQAFAEILQENKTNARDSLLKELEDLMETIHPKDPHILAALGDKKLAENNKLKALNYYRKSLEFQHKNEPVLQRTISLMFELQKDFVEIEELTVLAVDEFPKKSEFWFFDGTSKLGQKKYEEAEKSLVKALEVNKNINQQMEVLIYGQLGDAYHSLDKKEEAYTAYEKVLKINPNNEHILNNYAYFLSLDKKDLDKAHEMSSKLVRRFPDNATYLDTHAWVLFQSQKYVEAKKYMEKALENQDQPSGVMYEHYGDILYKLDSKEEALKYWRMAEELDDISEFLTLKIKNRKYYE